MVAKNFMRAAVIVASLGGASSASSQEVMNEGSISLKDSCSDLTTPEGVLRCGGAFKDVVTFMVNSLEHAQKRTPMAFGSVDNPIIIENPVSTHASFSRDEQRMMAVRVACRKALEGMDLDPQTDIAARESLINYIEQVDACVDKTGQIEIQLGLSNPLLEGHILSMAGRVKKELAPRMN